MNIISLFLLGISTSAVTANNIFDTMNTTTVPTEPPAKPTHIYVCGEDYFDAERNCNTNTECPTGDGCNGSTCYAVPYARCATSTAAGAKDRNLRGQTFLEEMEEPSTRNTCRAAGAECSVLYQDECCSGTCYQNCRRCYLGQCA